MRLRSIRSNSSFNFVERSFDVNVTKFLMPYENTSIFSKEFKVFGFFPPKEEIISKINIVGENPSSLKASLDIMRSSDLSDDEQTSFDFFVKLDAIKKIRLNNFLESLNFFSVEKKRDISLSNAVAKISLKFDLEHVELNSFDGKINELVYFENNKPSLELENIDFEGKLKQGHAAINSVTKVGLH